MKETFAIWISSLFHPFVMPVFVLWLVQILSNIEFLNAAAWTALCFSVVVLPVLGFVLIRMKQERYKDLGVSIREDRYLLYGLGGICFLVLIGLLYFLNAPSIVQKTLHATSLAFVVAAIFNKVVSKVSLHMLGTVASAVVLFSTSTVLALIFGFSSLIVGWSRLTLKRHTLVEIFLGAVIAFIIVGSWFNFSQ